MGHIDSVATIITERNTTLFDHCRVAPSRTYLEKPLVVVNHGMDAGTLILRAVKGCLYICAYTCITEDKKKALHDDVYSERLEPISMVQAPPYILWADGHRGFSVHTV